MKCEHKTSTVLITRGDVSLTICDFGCDSIFLDVVGGDGLTRSKRIAVSLNHRETIAAFVKLDTPKEG